MGKNNKPSEGTKLSRYWLLVINDVLWQCFKTVTCEIITNVPQKSRLCAQKSTPDFFVVVLIFFANGGALPSRAQWIAVWP